MRGQNPLVPAFFRPPLTEHLLPKSRSCWKSTRFGGGIAALKKGHSSIVPAIHSCVAQMQHEQRNSFDLQRQSCTDSTVGFAGNHVKPAERFGLCAAGRASAY